MQYLWCVDTKEYWDFHNTSTIGIWWCASIVHYCSVLNKQYTRESARVWNSFVFFFFRCRFWLCMMHLIVCRWTVLCTTWPAYSRVMAASSAINGARWTLGSRSVLSLVWHFWWDISSFWFNAYRPRMARMIHVSAMVFGGSPLVPKSICSMTFLLVSLHYKRDFVDVLHGDMSIRSQLWWFVCAMMI